MNSLFSPREIQELKKSIKRQKNKSIDNKVKMESLDALYNAIVGIESQNYTNENKTIKTLK